MFQKADVKYEIAHLTNQGAGAPHTSGEMQTPLERDQYGHQTHRCCRHQEIPHLLNHLRNPESRRQRALCLCLCSTDLWKSTTRKPHTLKLSPRNPWHSIENQRCECLLGNSLKQMKRKYSFYRINATILNIRHIILASFPDMPVNCCVTLGKSLLLSRPPVP